MKKITLFFLSLLVMATTGFAECITLENQTAHPKEKTKIAVQWATSTKNVQEGNEAIIHGTKLQPGSMQMITKTGPVKLKVPNNAQYFRVLVWSQGKGDPDLLTNWVDIIPNKSYILKDDQLIPSVLMPGSGC